MSSLRIVGLKAHGIKALRAVEMSFDADGSLITIGGENAAGKTSVLDLIESCLSKPVRNLARYGEASARGSITIADEETGANYEIARVQRGKTMALEVTMDAPGGMGRTSVGQPADFVAGLMGSSALVLDPLAFLNGAPVDKRNMLADVLGIRETLDIIEADCKELRKAASLVDARQQAAEDRFKGMPEFEGLPPAEVEAGPLLAELEALNARNAERAKMRSNRANVTRQIQDADDQIAELERQLAAAREKRTKLMGWMDINPEPEADESAAELNEQIARVSETNRQIRQNQEKSAAREEWKAQEVVRAGAWKQVREREAQKKDLLAAQQMPVSGLEFIADADARGGLLLNGIPFESASHAQQLEAAAAIARAGAGRVRVLLVRDASTLDNRKLKALAEIAERMGAVVFAEIVSNRTEDGSYDRKTTYTIEDGAVVAAEQAGAA